MRWLLVLFIFAGIGLYSGFIFVKGYPYKLYSNWVNGREWNKYYEVRNYKTSYLAPIQVTEQGDYKEDYPQLWKTFAIKNSNVPLPTRHPLYLTIPILRLSSEGQPPVIGMNISTSEKRKLISMYAFPTSLRQDFSLGQELFKLPFVRNRIRQFNSEKIWRDIFFHRIVETSKTMEEMIHDLYVLHIRSKLLPPKFKSYSLIDENKAIIELNSSNKDFKVELVLHLIGNRIFSYALETFERDQEAMKLRSKFIKEISSNIIDPSMGRILYAEFKQLNFSRQFDQEGLLYLFSAWTQDLEKVELLKEMVFYMERGRDNSEQLKVLYKYAFNKYGKTFTTKNIFSDSDDQNLVLQRKIEIENIEKKQEAEKMSSQPVEAAELSPEEKRKLELKKAKEAGDEAKQDLTVH